MITTDKQKILAHLAQPPRITSFMLYGYLPVTVAVTPDRYVRDGDTMLHYWVKAVVGNSKWGDSHPVLVGSLPVITEKRRPGRLYGVMKAAARQVARNYLENGQGVRSRAGVPDAFHAWISGKSGIDCDIETGMYMGEDNHYLISMLEGRRLQLRYFKACGRIGRTADKGAAWLL